MADGGALPYKQTQFRSAQRAPGTHRAKQTQFEEYVKSEMPSFQWQMRSVESCKTKPISGRSRRRGPLGVPPSGGSESLPAQPVPFRADREERGDSDCRTRLKAELRTEEPPGGVKRQTNPISGLATKGRLCETNPISGGGHGLLTRTGCQCHDAPSASSGQALAGTLPTRLARARMVLRTSLPIRRSTGIVSAHEEEGNHGMME